MNLFRRKSKNSKNLPIERSRQRQFKHLVLESLETRRVFATLPFGAFPEDTAEFMLGTVAVTPVFLESSGQQDPSTEDWTSAEIETVLENISEGLQWWVDTLATISPTAHLEFNIDTTYATTPVATKYEPINRISNDYSLWVNEFLAGVGFSGETQTAIRNFNQSQREKLDTDWSFTIFVVASHSDADGQFAPGGSFSRAFAFAGGLFEVVPATRPASTFAHETGHMFWARDEYFGAGSHSQLRGYYNTPNTNAADNPTPGFVQQPSIMAAGTLLDNAYANHLLPATTRAMIGWQDTDGDGIFDVLDVPLKLTGSGFVDSTSGAYKFQGQASVQTLPNLNPEGFKNDITINRVREVEYRFNDGIWQTISQPNTHVASLDLSIPVPADATTIEIRARDSQNSVSSNIFSGRIARADATQVPGINGYAWVDTNKNGLRDTGEYGLPGWTVNVLTSSGQPINLRTTIEPDSYPDGQLASNFSPLVNLNAVGSDADGRVGVYFDSVNSTGTKNFRGFSKSAQSYLSTWTGSSRRLQINFASPTSEIEIDAIGAATLSYGRLEAYNAAGQLLGRYTTAGLANGVVESMKISRGSADIAYAIVGGHSKGSVRLDNLRFGPKTQTLTGAQGQYSLPSLPAGAYQVQVTSPDFNPINPAAGRQSATVTANTATTDIDFGFTSATSQWQNPTNRLDVNNSNSVSPIDALLVINQLNTHGSRKLADTDLVSPPFVDVNGDGNVSPIDALLVINFLNNRNSGSGEGEGFYGAEKVPTTAQLGNSGPSGAVPEGEFALQPDVADAASDVDEQPRLIPIEWCMAYASVADEDSEKSEDFEELDVAGWLAIYRG